MTPKKKVKVKSKAPKAEEIAKLREQAAKAEEYLDLAQRAKADFINYQERVKREKEALAKYAAEDFIREFLPALDALRESIRTARSGAGAGKFLEGMELMEKEFLKALAKSGVVPIEAEGKPFDPAFHEALSVVEDDGAAPNTVLAELRRGWMLHDRVLRAAQVQIARAPAKPADPPAAAAEAPSSPDRD
ncbi:MAG: nucleotide exchange factor GrpE [Planctomycetota bacterium]|jgi:molecular chaperone GrpE